MSKVDIATSASSSDLDQYSQPEWSEDSDINPVTSLPWAANDTLTCSCGIIFTVHSKGFAALEQHHRSARHYDALRRRVRQAVNKSMLERAMADIQLGETDLDSALKANNHHISNATKRDADGNPKQKPRKITASKTAPASGLSLSAQLKENALSVSSSSSSSAPTTTSKLEQLRSELLHAKAEFRVATGPTEGSLAVKTHRLEKLIREAELMATLKKQRKEARAELKARSEKLDPQQLVKGAVDQYEDNNGSRTVDRPSKKHYGTAARTKVVTFFED